MVSFSAFQLLSEWLTTGTVAQSAGSPLEGGSVMWDVCHAIGGRIRGRTYSTERVLLTSLEVAAKGDDELLMQVKCA